MTAALEKKSDGWGRFSASVRSCRDEYFCKYLAAFQPAIKSFACGKSFFTRGQMRVISRSAAEREGSQCMEPIRPTTGSGTGGCMVYNAVSKAKGTTQ